MKKIILFILAVLPTIITAISLPFIDEKVPLHFGLDGVVDRYGSKYELFIVCGILLLVYLFWIVLIKLYSKFNTQDDAKAENNINVMYIIFTGAQVLISVSYYAALAIALRSDAVIDKDIFMNIVTMVLSGIFIVIGNVMPKLKTNSIAGVRTSWTMNSEKAWYLANRNCSIAFVISGFAGILLTIFYGGGGALFTFLCIVLILNAAAYFYAKFKFKKQS